MVTPNPTPDSGRPTPIEGQPPRPADPGATSGPDRDQYSSGNPETATQEDLASSDGAGIRGDYGDAEQTNGLEGGEDSMTDAGPDRAGSKPTNDGE